MAGRSEMIWHSLTSSSGASTILWYAFPTPDTVSCIYPLKGWCLGILGCPPNFKSGFSWMSYELAITAFQELCLATPRTLFQLLCLGPPTMPLTCCATLPVAVAGQPIHCPVNTSWRALLENRPPTGFVFPSWVPSQTVCNHAPQD